MKFLVRHWRFCHFLDDYAGVLIDRLTYLLVSCGYYLRKETKTNTLKYSVTNSAVVTEIGY